MRSRTVLLLVGLLGIALLAFLFGRAALREALSAPRAQTESEPRGENVRLESEAASTRAAPGQGAPASGDADAAAAPPLEMRIDGFVLRPDGKPAAEARVRYLREQSEDSTVTDEQGRFTIRPVESGHWRLVASHDDFAESAWTEFDVAAGDPNHDVKLVLREYGRIVGLVLDAHNVARAKVKVQCEDLDTNRALFGETDGAGRFEFAKVAPGSEIVSAKLEPQELDEIRADAPYLANRLSLADQQQNVELSEGQTVEIVLGGIPAGGVRVFGRVTSGEHGLAHTWIWTENYNSGWFRSRARTDERGEYELWVSSRDTYDFHILGAAGGLHLARKVVIGSEHEQRVDFEVPAGSIRGRVVDGAGRPVAGVRLGLDLQGQGYEPQPESYLTFFPSCMADAEGRFAFVNLPAGRYDLSARAESKPDAESAYAFTTVHDLELAAGAAIADLEVVLTPGGTIRGVVHGMPESTARQLYVSAFDEGGRKVGGTAADADGTFVLRGLVEGNYGLAARGGMFAAPAGAPVRVRRNEETQVELTVKEALRVRVVPKCPPEEQPTSLDLSIRDERGNQVWDSNSYAPELDFGSVVLAPGSYRFEFSGPGGWTGVETALLGMGGDSRVEVALRHPK